MMTMTMTMTKGGLSSLSIHLTSSPVLSPGHSNSKCSSTPKLGRIKAAAAAEAEVEMRVCLNRTCRRQGSTETLQILTGIAPPHVSVKSCGCLGRCGAGPNVVVLPDGVFFGHCGTAARSAGTMSRYGCGEFESGSFWSEKSLKALALRKRAEAELANGRFSQAELLLSQAIDLKPFGGLHITYKERSATRLAMGNMAEALEDAIEALTLAPKYPEAYICQGDVYMAIDQFNAAEKSYLMALELEPSTRRSKSFKVRIAKLQEKRTSANLV